MSKYEDTLKRVLKMSFRSTRAEMGITQAQMAELLHISTRAYAELEYGRSLCSTSVFVAYILNCSVDLQHLFNEIEAAFEKLERDTIA